MTEGTSTARPAAKGPIAYLTGEYPRATDTFIQREVAALRAMGWEVLTHSVRATDARHHVGPEQRAEHAATFAVLPHARRPLHLLRAHASLLGRRWLGAGRLAWRTRPPGLRGGLWQLFYFLEAGVLAHRLRARGAVHLHNHFGNSSCSVAMLAAEMTGLPWSYTMHGPMEFFEPRHWRIDEKVARAAFVACISHFARAQGMIFAAPAHWDRMRIVHCGVEPERYGPEAGRAAGERMLFVGRLAGIKGVPVLLRALARVAERRPAARLALVGDGPERGAIEREARRLGIADRVEFLGYLDQEAVAAELARSDLFVLPSFAEGVPVVLMEAMASGLPVVATRVAGVGELVEDGVSGRLVAPGDEGALAQAIEAMLADRDGRAAMAQAGRRMVEAAFDVRGEAQRLAALFADPRAALPEHASPRRPEAEAEAEPSQELAGRG